MQHLYLVVYTCYLWSLVTQAASPTEIASGKYSRMDDGVAEFPGDIFPNATEIYLSGNVLRAIFTKKEYQMIELLDLMFNKFAAFPDLSMMSASLKTLLLKGNSIEHLSTSDFTKICTTLEVLDLSQNLLTGFPDVAFERLVQLNLGNNMIQTLPSMKSSNGTLLSLSISSNAVPLEVDFDAMISLRGLQTLSLGNSQLQTVPNLCWVAGLGSVDLLVNPWYCDCRLRWMLWAHNSRGPSYLSVRADILICMTPPTKMYTQITSWNPAEMTCLGQYRSSYYLAAKQGDLSCQIPEVSLEIGASSKVSCALLCLSDVSCLVYGVEEVTSETALTLRCLLTDVTKRGNNSPHLANVMWFVSK